MQRIAWLEERGAHLAAMSDLGDGDCARSANDPAPKAQILAECGLSLDQLVCPPQVHGVTVLKVDTMYASGVQLPKADGLITSSKGVILGVTIADCVPVWLLQPQRGIAALLHAGRAGTLHNICGEAIRQISNSWGLDVLNGLYAYIGPSAGPCCYEVSTEIAEEFSNAGLPAQGRNLDLWQANRVQLESAGIPAVNIKCAAHCTICMGSYHSYRAHKTQARNIALLML